MSLQAICNRAADGRWELPADGWFMLAPKGKFPHAESGKVQLLDSTAVQAMANRFKGPVLVDYDHFSYSTDKPSEAAGWIDQVEARADGLWGKVKWTPEGEQALRNGRYRFLSPVWLKRDCEVLKGDLVRPLHLDSAGLTNTPNLKGIAALANRGNGEVDDFLAGVPPGASEQPTEEGQMNELMSALGLVAAASEVDALTAVAALKNRVAEAEKKIGEKDAELAKANEALKNRETELGALREAQVEAVLNKHATKFDPKKRADWKKALLANRADAEALLDSIPAIGELGKPAAAAQPLHNRAGAKTPAGVADQSEAERWARETNEALKNSEKKNEAMLERIRGDEAGYKAWREAGCMPALQA